MNGLWSVATGQKRLESDQKMHKMWNVNSVLIVVYGLIISICGTSFANHSGTSPLSVYACEGQTLKIECSKGLVILVMRANYGRVTLSVCNEGSSTEGWNTLCTSSKSLGIVSHLCNNHKERCQIVAESKKFGDPCPETPKYLEVQYRCLPGGTSNPVTYLPETRSQPPTPNPPSSSPFQSTEDTSSHIQMEPSTSDDSYSVGDKTPESWCQKKSRRNILWPKARPGETVLMNCPNNQAVAKASWTCGQDSVDWIDQPDLSQCISPEVVNLLALANDIGERFSWTTVDLFVNDLINFIDVREPVYGGDLLNVLTAMQKVSNQMENHFNESGDHELRSALVRKANKAVIDTSDKLLEESSTESWQDIPKSKRADIATTLLSTIEKCAHHVASLTTKPDKFLINKTNLVVEVRVVNTSGPVDNQVFPQGDFLPLFLNVASGASFIELDRQTVIDFGVSGLSKMVFATFNNIDKWLTMDDSLLELEADGNGLHEIISSSKDTVDNYANNYSQIERNRETTNELPTSSKTEFLNLRNKTVNTRIISAAFVSRDLQNVVLNESVVFVMKHNEEENASDPSCVFWNYSKISMKGRWSTHGCILDYTNATHTQCSCKHLTNFAVLMSINEQQLTPIQKFSLSFLTYFGCILSIICLAVAFLTFHSFKNLRCDRNTIHKNLVINLCIAEIIFLAGIVQYEAPTLCAIVAGLLHYLFLVSFLWMCLEGIQLYVMLVEVFEAESSQIKWYYLSAYGIPAVIVIISCIVNSGGYGTPSHCWLSTDKGFIWAFVGPVCVIIFINLIMLSIAIYVMCSHASNAVNVWKTKQKTTFENIRSWVKGAVVLVVLLGLTWIFGLFYINSQSIFMAYIFTAFNSTQGLFIFLFHCLMNEKVQKEYKRWVRHTKWLPEDLRVRCGGVRSSASVSPIHSSSSGVNKIVQEQKKSFEYITRLFSRNADRKKSSTTTLPSSSNNNIKRDYTPVHQPSGCRTGSGENESSQVYSEPTEDPYSYLESAQLALGQEEDFYLATGDISMMEGSVADTDYLDNITKRASSVIDIDKYKIRNQMLASSKMSATIPAKPLAAEPGQERQKVNEDQVGKDPEQNRLLMSFTDVGVQSSASSFPPQKTNLPENVKHAS